MTGGTCLSEGPSASSCIWLPEGGVAKALLEALMSWRIGCAKSPESPVTASTTSVWVSNTKVAFPSAINDDNDPLLTILVTPGFMTTTPDQRQRPFSLTRIGTHRIYSSDPPIHGNDIFTVSTTLEVTAATLFVIRV